MKITFHMPNAKIDIKIRLPNNFSIFKQENIGTINLQL